ncbi:Growth arrest-specific protein 7 [Sciurus carolinensis]|uniref:Growth arrest-specific protein 7 n=1 Tax=Sciurus carolinensis TaxID=30640 RepID=A0AA41TC54_SCICA|nr:Growth arrest-specific protein 7 [Sciurus carolinensis]
MPEQQLLKPMEWSYCDYFWVIRKTPKTMAPCQAQPKWCEVMMTTTLELEQLEVERVEMIQQHLCQYTQLRQEMDMFNQSTVETVDQLL